MESRNDDDKEKKKRNSKLKKPVNLKIEAAGGLAAGIIGTVIGYPLDLVKTRMQTTATATATATSTATANAASSSNNVFQIGYNIARSEGVTALYKGMTPPLISLCILNTMTFTSYNYLRTQYGAKRGFDVRNGLAGMSTAPAASIISTVEHLLKTQMQLDNLNEKRFRSSWECLKTLVKEHNGGLRILYLGHGVNTMRECVFIGTYFYTYEGMRIKLDQLFRNKKIEQRQGHDNDDGEDYDYYNDGNENHKAKSWTIPFAGGCAGAFAWFVSFPLDCVKAGVQGQSLSTVVVDNGNTRRRRINTNLKSMSTVYHDLIRNKGWRGLYSGVSPSIMRAFIVSSSRFTAYELVVKLCGDYLR